MVRKLAIASLFSGSFLFLGCNRDGGTGPGTIDPANIIGAWILASATINPGVDFGGGTITDMYSMMDPCERDDVHTFAANGTFTDSEGATSCVPANSDAGTWVLSGNLLIETSTGGSPDTSTIASLSATRAVIQISAPAGTFGDAIARTMTMTANKQ